MNSTKQPDFDVGIIGGGPAGSSLASYLAKAGVSCVVFEQSLFPRPHVGESLVPSANHILEELDLLGEMEAAKFPHKHGAAWTSIYDNTYSYSWEELLSLSQIDTRFQKYTYHVDRAKFDLILLQHAQKLGATVYEGVRVKHVDFPEDDYPQINFLMGKQDVGVRVRLAVDASGRGTVLGRQLKLRVPDPVFNQVAMHAWFEGYDRGDPDKDGYIFIHFLPRANTWVWQIPISDTVTSFGIVTQKDNLPKQKEAREDFFWENLKTRPEVFERLQKAQQLHPLKIEGDYSYSMKQICGDGFILVGDAARFVDPIFSSGISAALHCAHFASQDIIKAIKEGHLNNGVFKREHMQNYETTLKRGMKNWYEFISLYYRLNVLFTTFIQNPEYQDDVHKLLQGEVYDQDNLPVLEKMREIITQIEQNPKHPWHQLLNDLTSPSLEATL